MEAGIVARAAALVLLALAGCAPALRVGSSGDYPPFSERTADGGWKGLDVDVARAFARDRGRRVRLVPMRWPELEPALARGDFDVAMSGVTVRADRLVTGRFTAAVARAQAVLVAPRGTRSPRRVGVNRGGHLERVARATLPGVELVTVEGNQLRGLLDSGAVDGSSPMGSSCAPSAATTWSSSARCPTTARRICCGRRTPRCPATSTAGSPPARPTAGCPLRVRAGFTTAPRRRRPRRWPAWST